MIKIFPPSGDPPKGEKFPEGFLWGAATSAHQVEGNNHNDWTEWEKENAERLSKESGGKYPRENYISGRACDHYNRYEEDFDLAKKMGHNAHRFSIEWSRIEPEEGKFNQVEIEHYRKVISALKERGIEPFVTLWHWTNPIWIRDIGGWENKKTIEYFVRYSKKIVTSLPEVKLWITMNEQEAFARHGYFLKDRPPAQGTIFTAYRVLKNLSCAHKLAYRALKNLNSNINIGFSESLVYFEPYNHWPHNVLAMKVIKWWRNNVFFSHFEKNSDFIGLQYYFHSRIRLNLFVSQWSIQYNENREVSDFGWEIYPEGIYHILKDLKKYNKPVYITENGVADARDIHRAKFIQEHVQWIKRAIAEGVDVKGYLYWSLMDNFEWQAGFWPRFGLVEIDYRSLERRIRSSAFDYKKIIKDSII